MARMPRGAEHIDNPVSVAPGFRIGNVHVMAGVPSIFQAMLDNVVPTLRTGTKLLSATVQCPFGEGLIGGALAEIQKAHPDTIIGSYPKYLDGSVLDRAGGARPQRGSARKRTRGRRGDGRRLCRGRQGQSVR